MDLIPLLIFVIVIIAGITITQVKANKYQQTLHTLVQNAGGKNIKIIHIMFSGDRDTYTFKVYFEDDKSRRYWTTCKINQDEIYWSHSPQALLAGIENSDTYTYTPTSKSKSQIPTHNTYSQKENLLDGLNSFYKYERIQTAKNIEALETAAEVVLQQLADLATTDPEPEVRQAAQNALQKHRPVIIKESLTKKPHGKVEI
ncbi:MAG: hypothetical protein Kow0080_16810 [Candidatus Promineifilaceae bacterium]